LDAGRAARFRGADDRAQIAWILNVGDQEHEGRAAGGRAVQRGFDCRRLVRSDRDDS
jgi:hypothetical protein